MKNLYVKKIHGNMYAEPGTPDMIGCFQGKFFGIENKLLTVPKRNTTLLKLSKMFTNDQICNILDIRLEGGYACGCLTVPEMKLYVFLSSIQLTQTIIDSKSISGWLDDTDSIVVTWDNLDFTELFAAISFQSTRPREARP